MLCGGAAGAARGRRAGELRLPGAEDQVAGVLGRRFGKRHELEIARASRGLHSADAERQRPARQGGAERDEMAALEIAEHLGLPPLHAQQIRGAGHVDVEKGAAHQKVGGFRSDVLGEFGQPLRSDDPARPRLRPGTSGSSSRRARPCGLRPKLRPRRRVQTAELRRQRPASGTRSRGRRRKTRPGRQRQAHLRLGVETFEVENDRNPMLAHPGRDPLKVALGAGRIDDHMAVLVGQRHEIALGIEDRLLHQRKRSVPEVGAAGATCRNRNCPAPANGSPGALPD